MLKEVASSVVIFVLSCVLSIILGVVVSFIGDHPNKVYRALRFIAQLTIFGLACVTADTSFSVFFSIAELNRNWSFLLSFALGSIVFILGIFPRFPKVMEYLAGPEIRLKHNE